ncbi:MAG TPA: MBL fold metallo-hydrolase [Nocardioidaceae bacterium]|nr:MBL fold metallo-hydrolase [Nocardioidaceae bacterium]
MAEWAAPGAHEVDDGVFRVPLSMPGDGLHAINVYAIETGDGLALVDGGWRTATSFEELESALAGVGHRASSIHDVYVTHIHRDHYTLAVELRRRFGTRVQLGRDEAPGLHELLEIASNVPVTSLQQLRRSGDPELAEAIEVMAAAEEFDVDGWEKPDVWLEPGTYAVGGRTFEAVATPGHTKGHLVYHDLGAELLFAGDHLLPTISPSIGFELGEWELPLGSYLSSLEHILERPDARLLPAHGAPGPSAHARATELLEHHDVRLADTSRALDKCGSATASTVAQLLQWTRRGRSYDELDPFNKMIATCETIAHLDVLVDLGRARVSDDPDGAFFSLV